MDNDDNIFKMHKNDDEQKLALVKMKEGLPHLIEMYVIKATLVREYYNALIEQGFNEEQALKIVSEFKMSSL